MVGFHPNDNTWLLCARMGGRPVYITKLSNEIQFAEDTETEDLGFYGVGRMAARLNKKALPDEGRRPHLLIAKIDIELRPALRKARRADYVVWP